MHDQAASLRGVGVDLLSSSVPCLAVDRDGIVCGASPSARSNFAPALNRSLADTLGIANGDLAEHLAGRGNRMLVGRSVDASGRIDPVLAQAVDLPANGLTLLILTDLGPSRSAEETRFQATPYPVLRLSPEGLVLFANQAAEQTLGTDLLQRSLPDLFPEPARAELAHAIEIESRESRQFDLPAPEMMRRLARVGEVRLYLTPDMGPADQVLGRLAVIAYDPWEWHRNNMIAAVNRADEDGWEDTLRRILDILREIIPYDRATFGVFDEERANFRVTLVHPQPDIPWPRRWISVPPERLARLAKGPVIERDLAAVLARFPTLAADPIVKLNMADGIQAALVVPVGAQDRPGAALSLCASDPAAFKGPALALIGSLRLEALLLLLLRKTDREVEDAVARIGNNIIKASSFSSAAELLLAGLVDQFNWDHAALYIADGARKRTVLFRQYPLTEKGGVPSGLTVPHSFAQPLDPDRPEQSGMLGAAFWAGEALLVEDTSAPGPDGKPPYNFRPGGTAVAQCSAMTVPVRLDGEIRWLLDIESKTTHAFGRDDKRMVERIVRRLEQNVALAVERMLTRELLTVGEQGVIVTDSGGRIRRANTMAKDLLGLAGEPEAWGLLKDRGADHATRELLASAGSVERSAARVRMAASGVGNAVLVSRRALAPEAGYAVWLLTDLRGEEWTHDSSFVESVIREVARQARGSLLLATSLVKRIAEGNLDGDLAARAAAELHRANLTYERIAESLAARKEPLRFKRPLRVDTLLSDIVHGLPRRDGGRIVPQTSGRHLRVEGDGGRLELALRLAVGFMLSHAHAEDGQETKIKVAVHRRDATAVIGLAPEPTAKPAARLRPYHAKPGCMLETVAIILEAHGGRMSVAELETHHPRVEFALPLTEAHDG